ncbi:MAG: peptidylprolyl isomerase [Methylacidiphilales bacterium]|nr:peptidylprolyl isomerase [Candidatus Methylacidiphilales bacterium]
MDFIVKKLIGLAAIAAVLAALACGSLQAQVVDGVAAVVNDKVITFSQVRKEVDPTEAQYRQLYSGMELVEKVKEARLSALKALIERELIIQEFTTGGYFIPDNVIEDRMKKIVEDQFGGDRATLIRTLQAQGVSIANFKENLRNQTIVRGMQQRNIASAVIVSPYQIEQYYQDNARLFVRPDEIKLRDIFLKKGLFKDKRIDKSGQEIEVDPQRMIIDEILGKIRTGSDFASLARGYSEGGQKNEGGDLGWVSESSLRSELVKVAFKLHPGQNSGVIETDDGYHILLVEEVKKATVMPMSEVRDRIESTLLQQERERLQQEWLDSLRSKAFIKMFF